MTKPDVFNYQLVCRDCGLEARVPHASLRECVEALQLEWTRLSEHLRRGQLDVTAIDRPESDGGVSSMSLRLRLDR